MSNIQIGTILCEDDDTTAIYNKFREYFEVVKKDDWLIMYAIAKEPSKELFADIEIYYVKVKEQNRKHGEFVDRVAQEVYEELSESERSYIFDHPASTDHHFGMGLGIRNRYIHGQDLDFDVYNPDSLSSEITSRIASLIVDNYDYENPFYHHLYDNFSFNHIRRLYRAVTGNYPNEIMDKYVDMPDDTKAAKIVENAVKAIVLNGDRFKCLCKKYKIPDAKYQEFKKFVNAYNSKKWDIIPYDVAVLYSRKLDAGERNKWLQVMQVILKQAPRMAIEMPAFIFNQKDTVMLAVSSFGRSLQRFKNFSTDDEVIRAALMDNGEAIQYVDKSCRYKTDYIKLALSNEYSNALKKRCMIPYRDRNEWVKIALESNGCNIEWASQRIKDDFELAAFAVRHQRNWYPESTICNLSTRLRDNLDIALIDIREGHACVNSYSRRLKDSDEVAEALIDSEYKWKLYMMSKRIQKKYDEGE